MNVYFPAYQELPAAPKFLARLKHWSQTLVIPEETGQVLLEAAKFLGTVALILAGTLILLMAA